jgi:hypothetical protein
MFPVYTTHCEQMKEVMEEIQQKDAREDVKKMAQVGVMLCNNVTCVTSELGVSFEQMMLV